MTSFQILNALGVEMIFIHEPEGFEFSLPPNEEVTIQVESVENSIVLVNSMHNNSCVVSVMDDKCNYRVFYKGEDVFEKFL